MGAGSLSQEQEKGVKASVVVVFLVLALFLLILVAGQPIVDLGSEPLSVAYTVLIYTPVMAICLLAYRRLR